MRAGTIWITGIPCSGKTTLARIVAQAIRSRNGRAEVLDGDDMRRAVSAGLGFSRDDRAENVRRIAWAARLAARSGAWAVVAAVSPFRDDRDAARRASQGEGLPFVEVHARCPLEAAEARDVKGLYAAARAGTLQGLTGLDGAYEAPVSPEAVVDTDREEPKACAERILRAALWRPDDNPPVICFGRGYAGTRAASMLLQDLGVFIGVHKNVNECDDSLDWKEPIYGMVAETSGMAELPMGAHYRDEIHQTAWRVLWEAPVPPGAPWGWKLPETTLVLPFFDDAFPKAKFVHLVRHPARACVRSPHITSDPFHDVGKDALPGAYAYAGRPKERAEEDADWLRNALAWRHQVGRAMAYGRDILGPSRYVEVKFEDVATDPDGALQRLSEFLGLPRARWRPSFRFDPERAVKVGPKDPRPERVWRICGEVASALGYEERSYERTR